MSDLLRRDSDETADVHDAELYSSSVTNEGYGKNAGFYGYGYSHAQQSSSSTDHYRAQAHPAQASSGSTDHYRAQAHPAQASSSSDSWHDHSSDHSRDCRYAWNGGHGSCICRQSTCLILSAQLAYLSESQYSVELLSCLCSCILSDTQTDRPLCMIKRLFCFSSLP